MRLIKKPILHSDPFLKDEFIAACELAKASAYGNVAFLNANLNEFKQFPESAQYRKKLEEKINLLSRLTPCS